MSNPLRDRKKAFISAFNTPDGKKVLEYLTDDIAHRPAFDTDALVMAKRAGEADFVRYIIDMATEKKHE